MYEYEAEVVRVVDGDTIDLDVDLGFRMHAHIRVRLQDVDTPEKYGVKAGSPEHQRGVAATEFTANFLEAAKVPLLVRTYKTGKYGRWLAEIIRQEDGVVLNSAISKWMVEQGWTED